MSVNSPMFGNRYFSLGVIVYIITTYLCLQFDTYLDKNISNVFVYSLCYATTLTILFGILYIAFHKNKLIHSQILIIYFAVIIFIIGFLRVSCVHSNIVRDNYTINHSIRIYGYVTSEPKLSSSGKSCLVGTDVFQVDTPNGTEKLDKPIHTVTYIAVDSIESFPSVGDTFKCSYKFELNMKPSFKGAFDYSRYLRQSNVCYAGYTYNYKKLDDVNYNPTLFRKLCNLGYNLRFAITKSFDAYSYSDDEKALLGGILLGDVSHFSDELYDAYTDSGLIHIASVSGMHTSYLFLVISIILTLMRIPKRIFAIFTIPVLVLFASIALFTPSVNRSVIMLSVMLLSSIFKRNNDSITSLFVAAFIIVFKNPYCLESYSFILSFSATLGLLIFANPINAKLTAFVPTIKVGKISRLLSAALSYILNSISLSLSGTLGISFFTSEFFGRITYGGIIGNLIIFPAVALIFIFGFLNSVIFYVCKPLSKVIAKFVLNPALIITNHTAAFFSKDIFSINTMYISKFFFIVYLIICFAIYMLLIKNKKKENRS